MDYFSLTGSQGNYDGLVADNFREMAASAENSTQHTKIT
jgi:hypothetical protein